LTEEWQHFNLPRLIFDFYICIFICRGNVSAQVKAIEKVGEDNLTLALSGTDHSEVCDTCLCTPTILFFLTH
jgi:hypothetical protein